MKRLLAHVAMTVFGLIGALLIIIGIAQATGGTGVIVVGAVFMTPLALELASWAFKGGARETVEAFRIGEKNRTLGLVNPALVCPHCQVKGNVRTLATDRKTGVSGAKVVGAVLLGPLSLLTTGLSSTEQATRAHCDACSSTWVF